MQRTINPRDQTEMMLARKFGWRLETDDLGDPEELWDEMRRQEADGMPDQERRAMLDRAEAGWLGGR